MFEVLYDVLPGIAQMFLVFSILFALFQCFFGYRLLKFWISVIGFVIGFIIGFTISVVLIADNAYMPTIIGLIVGVLLALAAFKLYLAGVFVVCGVSAFVAVQTLPLPAGTAYDLALLAVGILAFLVAGYCSMRFARNWIIAVTAITGAANAVYGLQIPVRILAENELLFFLTAMALAGMGIYFQHRTTRAKESAEDIKEEAPVPEAPAAKELSPEELSRLEAAAAQDDAMDNDGDDAPDED